MAILAALPAYLTDYYDVRMGESGCVAGFDYQAVLLESKDNTRYGYNL